MLVNVAVNIVLAVSINYFAYLLRQLQLLVHTLLVNIEFTPNVGVLSKVLMQIAALELYSMDKAYDKIFGFTPD